LSNYKICRENPRLEYGNARIESLIADETRERKKSVKEIHFQALTISHAEAKMKFGNMIPQTLKLNFSAAQPSGS